MCRLRMTLISLVGAVKLTACRGESSALERYTKSLLFCSQYRAARVILKGALLRSLAAWIPCFFRRGSGNAGIDLLESSQNNTRYVFRKHLNQQFDVALDFLNVHT